MYLWEASGGMLQSASRSLEQRVTNGTVLKETGKNVKRFPISFDNLDVIAYDRESEYVSMYKAQKQIVDRYKINLRKEKPENKTRQLQKRTH